MIELYLMKLINQSAVSIRDESFACRVCLEAIDIARRILSQLLTEAELLVSELPSESPLRLRFATEINELRDMGSPSRSKRKY